MDSTNHGAEAELEKLRNDHIAFRAEISKLKQQNKSSMHDMAAIRERIRVTETKQKHMVVFMIKSLKNSMFLQYLIERGEMRRALSCGGLKKRRLASEGIDVEELIGASIDDEKNVDEELMIEAEMQSFSADESGTMSKLGGFDICPENVILWEKLMEDDVIYEGECNVETKKHSDIVSELEELIAEPANGVVEIVGSCEST